MKLRLAAIATLAALAGAWSGPLAQVRVQLAGPAVVNDVLAAELALCGVPVVVERRGSAAIDDGLAGVDLWLGGDGWHIRRLAETGALSPLDAEWVAGLAPAAVDEAGRFAVPWVVPWALFSAGEPAGGGAGPAGLEALAFDRSFDAAAAVCAAPACPDLWLALVGWRRSQGAPTAAVSAWLQAFDAGVALYAASPTEAARALDSGAVRIALLPVVGPAWLADPRLVVPVEGAPVSGAALGLVAGHRAEARAVVRALLSPVVTERLAVHGILPSGPRAPLAGAGATVAETLAVRRWPYSLAALEPGWIERWAAEVRGRGRSARNWSDRFDVVFVLIVAAVVVIVYLRRRRVAAADAPAE